MKVKHGKLLYCGPSLDKLDLSANLVLVTFKELPATFHTHINAHQHTRQRQPP